MEQFIYGKRVTNTVPANGVSGVLIRLGNGGYAFRVYEADYTFTDYDIRHDDLAVTIAPDELASFYTRDGMALLDHSPSVLGLRTVQDAEPGSTP